MVTMDVRAFEEELDDEGITGKEFSKLEDVQEETGEEAPEEKNDKYAPEDKNDIEAPEGKNDKEAGADWSAPASAMTGIQKVHLALMGLDLRFH
jgi:hypothetical protein